MNILFIIFIISLFTFAHCPLCTAGAGIGSLIAKELGMKSSAIGIWIGGFSVALGWLLANLIGPRIDLFVSHMRLRAPALNLLQRQVGASVLGSKTLPSAIADRQRPSFSSLRNVLYAAVLSKILYLTRSTDKYNGIIRLMNIFIIFLSFLSIVLPLKLYFYETGSFYLYLFGDYGSLFNRTYAYDKFLFGAIVGGIIILISPLISKKIIQLRQGKIFPYQGLIINFALMILVLIIFQI